MIIRVQLVCLDEPKANPGSQFLALDGSLSMWIMDVTGNFRKSALDKDIYFIDTVNLASVRLQNLKE